MLTGNAIKKWWLPAAGLAVMAVTLVVIVVWRADIQQWSLDPKVPYQVYHPPAAPNYALRNAWVILPPDATSPPSSERQADVFFVHPTTFDGGRDWNGPIDEPHSSEFLARIIIPNFAGPFVRVGRLFAPRYRQASAYAALTLRDDAREAREFAYGDVQRAFEYYLQNFDTGRPLILAGVEQGGLLLDRLVRDEMKRRPTLRYRIAAVYLVDTVSLRARFSPQSDLPACQSRLEAHCVVGWTQAYAFDKFDVSQTLHRSLVWGAENKLEGVGDRAILCVNPILGEETDAEAPARANLGAVAASEMDLLTRPAILARQVSARCEDGILMLSAPISASLRPARSWYGRLKEPDYNLFYADIEADSRARVAVLLENQRSKERSKEGRSR